jgi:hypothetical protein
MRTGSGGQGALKARAQKCLGRFLICGAAQGRLALKSNFGEHPFL